MKNYRKTKKIHAAIMLTVSWSSKVLAVGLALWFLITGLNSDYGWAQSLIGAVLGFVGGLLLPYLIYLLWWRLFTASGRRAEKRAEAIRSLNKTDRKRDREWREMNRGW